jgi:hypothetical protein
MGGNKKPAPKEGVKSKRWPPSPEHRKKVSGDLAKAFGSLGSNKKRR